MQSYSQFGNGQYDAVLFDAVPDPAWWTDNINDEPASREIVADQVHQESRIESTAVSFETLSATEVGTSSNEVVFPITCQPPGFCQQSFGFNMPANPDFDIQQKALQACPDATNSKVIRHSTSPSQPDWDDPTSPPTLPLDCDFRGNSSQESQEKRKSQVPRLDPFSCPHCCKTYHSRKQLRFAYLQ